MRAKHNVLANFPRGKLAFFVTSNVHKFNEARRVLSECKLATAMLKIEAVEIQDDNLENIAKASAIDAVKNCRLPIIVEDAGLFIEALNGFPGPYSRYVEDHLGNGNVLKLMEGVHNRKAVFRTVVGYCEPGCKPHTFTGEVKGTIAFEERGINGFGFDPIFLYKDRTFGELRDHEKNLISHRGNAMQKFASWLQEK